MKASHGHARIVSDILVGDVWFLTGSTLLTTERAYDKRDAKATVPEAMPLVREFRRRTAASTNPTPRKRGFEVGGDRKYRGFWQTADFNDPNDNIGMFAYHFARSLNRSGIPQGFVTMSAGQGNQMASPLSWTSFAGVKDVHHPVFRARLDALLLQDPNSEVSKKAIDGYLKTVKAEVAKIADMGSRQCNMAAAPLQFTAFPEPGRDGGVKPDTVPTLAYNWCVSPLTPMGVAGVIWVPGPANLGYTPADYSRELEIYARSLPATYGPEKVSFFYAQPAPSMVDGITAPDIPAGKAVTFDAWPKSLKEIAIQLASQLEM